MSELKEKIVAAIAEYGNDLFEGECNQRWKSAGELADHLLKLCEELENV